MINFTVVQALSPYNVILGRTGLRTLRSVSSTIHSMEKFPIPRGVATQVTRTMIISECRRLEKKQMIEKETNRSTLSEEEKPKRVNLTEQTLVNPSYPDQLVTIGGNLSEGCKNQLKALLKKSAYEEYHQVQMAQEDEEKTAFYMDQCTYCYTKMPFGLNNAGATYQRLVDTAFQSQIGRNLEAYVDDMVIKSNDEKVLIADIAKTFDNLLRINMKYAIPLDFKGDAEPEWKVSCVKEVLVLVPRKILAILQDLEGHNEENKDKYRWTGNAKKAFQEIKKVIVELLSLTTPRRKKCCQVLADFLSEALVGTPFEEFFRLPAQVQSKDDVERWALFIDGSSNNKGSGAGLVLINPSGVEFTYALQLNFTSTNNEAEYEALLAGLRLAAKVQDIDVKVDLKLAASQINEIYVASSTSMIKYLATARERIAGLKSFVI
ncbi:reverse transcriptase domain-containing protein [Tanacetum coccineum]